MRSSLVGVPHFARRAMFVLLIGLMATLQLLSPVPIHTSTRASAVRSGHSVRNSLLPSRKRPARHLTLLADRPGDTAQASLPTGRDSSLPPFPQGYAQSANVIQINPATEYTASSQSSDSATGWGDDVWQFALTSTAQISVEVDDCCLVGDNYEVYVTRTLTQTEDQIGVTPAEDISGTNNSTGVFTRLIGPGVHYVAIRDPGGVYWYNQGNSDFFPAGYNVDIKFITAGPGGVPLISRNIIFVHGIGMSSASPGFGPIHTDLTQLYGGGSVKDFAYVDDASLGKQASCAQYTPQGCVSQSAILPNAMKLASAIQTLSSQHGNKKVTLFGYSMGATIIRTMLAGCRDPNAGGAQKCPGVAGLVDNVFFINGVQQGSWTMVSKPRSDPTDKNGDVVSVNFLTWLRELAGPHLGTPLYPQDQAEQDLAPQSPLISAYTKAPPPSGIHYFNFYGDIQVREQVQYFIFSYSPPTTYSVGDLVLLPGSDNPTDTPYMGGAQFCLSCKAYGGYRASQPDATTTYTEWPMTDVIDWNINLLFPFFSSPITEMLQVASGAVDTALFMASLANAPEFHINIPKDGALTTIKVQDSTGLASGPVTIPQEILYHLEQEDGVEP